MNVRDAATRAHRTTATIRAWARMGAVAAVKTSGRWDIDQDSLDHRIALTAPARGPVVFSVDTLTAIGGSRWQKNGMDRVYINGWAAFAGLETSRYNTGNISSAAYRGEAISNTRATKILGAIDKVWFDTADGKLHARYGFSEPNWRDGSREDVWHNVVAGIRTAIAAL